MPSRRVFASVGGFVAVAVLLLVAQPWQPAPAFEPPDPPDDRSNESVREYALDYERALLDHRLSTDPDVTDYGLHGVTAPTRARVVHHTDAGAYVRVQFAYWYDTHGGHADAASRATYLVTRDDVRRVAEQPVRAPAVETYRGPGDADGPDDSTDLDRPVDVRVLNFGTTERSVALDLAYRQDGDPDAVWDRRAVAVPANATVALRGGLARTGTYELAVSAGERTAEREFRVAGDRTGDVVVYAGPGSRLVVHRANESW